MFDHFFISQNTRSKEETNFSRKILSSMFECTKSFAQVNFQIWDTKFTNSIDCLTAKKKRPISEAIKNQTIATMAEVQLIAK